MRHKYIPVFAAILAAWPVNAFAAACSASANGNWSAGGTWTGCTGPGGIPAAIDTITIPSGRTVTLDVDATVAGLTFAAPSASSALTHSGAAALTVNGPVVLNQGTSNNRTDSWNIVNGSATVTGLITFAGTGTTTSRKSTIAIDAGELNALGGITFTASASATKIIDMSGGAGRLNLKGNLTIPANSCTLTAGTAGSVFNYADTSAAQTVRFFTSGAYNVLAINNTSASGATLGAAVTATNVTGDLRVESGKLKNGGFAITGASGDTFSVAAGATFEMSGTSAFPAGYTTFSFDPSSRVRFLQTTSPLSLPTQTFGHLDLVPAGTATQRFPAGAVTVAGDLTVGNGNNAATADLDTNGPTLSVGGATIINAGSTLIADNTNPMNVAGDWTNNGTFTHNASTVNFNGASPQSIDNVNKAFGKITLANASIGGVTFDGPFSAAQMTVDTAALGAAATVYFEAGSTFTVTSLILAGTASDPVTVRSTVDGARWNLSNAGSQSVSYVRARDSNASGNAVFDYPAGADLGNNVNWKIGVNPPGGFALSSSQPTSLGFAWSGAVPAPEAYSLQVSPNADFSGTITTLSTALLTGTTSGLLVNTTYSARVASVIRSTWSAFSSVITTATLANPPLEAAATWSDVNIASVTFTWDANGNPAGTRFIADLSTVGDFSSGLVSTATSGGPAATFTGLVPATRYYARVRAQNRSGIDTSATVLPSTATQSVNPPSSASLSSVQLSSVSVAWPASVPAGDNYLLEVSDDVLFLAPAFSTSTSGLSGATPATLAVNTTYFARVATVVSGSTSAWTAAVSTATLAKTPSTAGTTWAAVHATSATVAWAANGNPAGTRYVVQLSTSNNFSGDILSSSTVNLSATVSQLESGATYFGRVRAQNHSGIATAFLTLGSTMTAAVPIPKNLAFTAAQTTQLSASWSASTPAGDSYDFRVSTDPAFGGGVTSASTTGLSVTLSGLSVNTTYFGAVRAILSGAPNPWSPYESTSTLANPPAPAGATWPEVNVTSVTVAWAANGNPAGTRYRIEVSTRNDFASAVLAQETTAMSASFPGLVPASAYYARVRAFNRANVATAFAALASTTTGAVAAPVGLAVSTVASTTITAAWSDAVPPADSFELQADDDPAFASVNASSATVAPSAQVSGLSVNATWYLRVRGIVNGGASGWSTSVATATLANVPSSAGSPWFPIGQTDASFAWTANGNPAGTRYAADLSDTSDFTGNVISTETTGTSAGFTNLFTDTDYWGRVAAVNRNGVMTDFLAIASTHTSAPNTCNAVATGNWSSPSTWSNCTGPGGLPAATDAVIINSARTVTLDVDATVAGLTFAAAGTANGLTHAGAAALTVNGNVVINQPTSNSRTCSWNINAGSATVLGPITFLGGTTTTSRVAKIVITSGQLNAMGGLSFTASAAATKVIDMSGGAGRLNLKGNLNIPSNSCTLTAGTAGSVFNFGDDASAQTIRFFTSGAYDHLYVNNTSAGGATLGAAVTTTNVVGDLRVQSGLLSNGGFAIAGSTGDTFEVADGASFRMTGTSSFPSGYTTVTIGSASRVRYAQTTNPKTIDSFAFGHLDLVPAGTATQRFPAGAFSVQGDLTVGDGTNAGTADLNTNGTSLTVGGSVVVNANATLAADNVNPLVVAGDWSNAGTFTANGSTVTFSGAAAQSVDNGGGTFANVVDQNVSPAGLTLGGTFSAAQLKADTSALASGATIYFTAGGTATIGAIVVTGTSVRPVTLRSTVDGSAWGLNNTGGSGIVHVRVKDSDASAGRLVRTNNTSKDLGSNVNWDFGPPEAVTDLSAAGGKYGATIDLSWSSPADAPGANPLMNSAYVVAYTSDTVFASGAGWSPTAALPAGVSRVQISTDSVWPETASRLTVSPLDSGVTYYFRLWTRGNGGQYSPISNGATTYATVVIASVSLSTDVLAFGSLDPGQVWVSPTAVVVTNHGNTDVNFAVAITDPAIWRSTSDAAGLDAFRLTGLFQDAMPGSGDFDPANDAVLVSTASASITSFARDGGPDGEKGVGVPPNSTRTLWFRMEMPPLSTTTDPQAIRLRVSTN